ncbi:MAG TPA: response regulator [Candidatus Thermoplasmatota archaeon]|nr:response regulator [Candidatus Thermoplasmatota archaeon]
MGHPLRETGALLARVLIVDDDLPLAESTKKLLEALGHEAFVVTDHRRVLGAMRSLRPDVVLHDYNMPGLRWEEHLAELRQDPVVGGIPLLLFTAAINVPDLERRLAFDGYVPKPFHPADLLQALGRVAQA